MESRLKESMQRMRDAIGELEALKTPSAEAFIDFARRHLSSDLTDAESQLKKDSLEQDSSWLVLRLSLIPMLQDLCAVLVAVDAEDALKPQHLPRPPSASAPAPAAPRGLLSLRDYAAINSVLEVIVYWGIAPYREIGGLGAEAWQRPASKSIKINHRVLHFAMDGCSSCGSGSSSLLPSEAATRVAICANAVQAVVLQDQFAPMLLPRLLPDLIVARWLAERGFASADVAAASGSKTTGSKMGPAAAQVWALEQLLLELPPHLAMACVRTALLRCSATAGVVAAASPLLPPPPWLNEAAGGWMSRLLICPGGIEAALELYLGGLPNDGGSSAPAIMRVAALLASPPRDISPSRYVALLAPQLRAMLAAQSAMPNVAAAAVVHTILRLFWAAPAAVREELLLPLLEPLLLVAATAAAAAANLTAIAVIDTSMRAAKVAPALAARARAAAVASPLASGGAPNEKWHEVASEEEVDGVLRALERLLLAVPLAPSLVAALGALPTVPALFELYRYCSAARAGTLSQVAGILRVLLSRLPDAAQQLQWAVLQAAAAPALPALFRSINPPTFVARFAPGGTGGVAVRARDVKVASAAIVGGSGGDGTLAGLLNLTNGDFDGTEGSGSVDNEAAAAAAEVLGLDAATLRLACASPEGAAAVAAAAGLQRVEHAAAAAVDLLVDMPEDSAVPGQLFESVLQAYLRLQMPSSDDGGDGGSDGSGRRYSKRIEGSQSRNDERALVVLAAAVTERVGPRLLATGLQALRCIGMLLEHEAEQGTAGAAPAWENGDADAGAVVGDGGDSDCNYIDKEDDGDNEESVGDGAGLCGVALGLLLTLLEVGEEKRLHEEEGALRALLPALQRLATRGRGADTAALASSAAAAILARSVTPEQREEGRTRLRRALVAGSGGGTGVGGGSGGAVNWDGMSEALESVGPDLRSEVVPLRARGVVMLTRLVQEVSRQRWGWTSGGGSGSRSSRIRGGGGGVGSDALIAEVGSAEAEEEIVGRYMCVFVDMTADEDSYVYLAAVQGLAAMADSWPALCIPRLLAAFVGRLETADGGVVGGDGGGGGDGGEGSGVVKGSGAGGARVPTLLQRLKIGEAVMFAARRCGDAMPHYAKHFVNALVLGARQSVAETTASPPLPPSLLIAAGVAAAATGSDSTKKEGTSTAVEAGKTEATQQDHRSASSAAFSAAVAPTAAGSGAVPAPSLPVDEQARIAFRQICLSNLCEVCQLLGWSVRPYAADIADLCLGMLAFEAEPAATTIAAAAVGAGLTAAVPAADAGAAAAAADAAVAAAAAADPAASGSGSLLALAGAESALAAAEDAALDKASAAMRWAVGRAEAAAAARRGAAFLLSGLIRGCGGDALPILSAQLKGINRALRRAARDPDAATRAHAGSALAALAAAVQAQMGLVI